jgi:hypothetical protein
VIKVNPQLQQQQEDLSKNTSVPEVSSQEVVGPSRRNQQQAIVNLNRVKGLHFHQNNPRWQELASDRPPSALPNQTRLYTEEQQ